MNITAKQLSGEHLLKTITVQDNRSAVTGQYLGINSQHDMISDPKWGGGFDYAPGRLTTILTVLIDSWFIEIPVEPDTPITIQEGQ